MTTPNSVGKNLSIALSTLLSTIRVANGYRTDIGLKVMRGRGQIDENSTTPFILIKEDTETEDARVGQISLFKETAQLRLEGFAACDLENPNDIAHDIVADFKKCLFSKKDALPEAFKVQYVSRSIGSRESGLKINGGAITIALEYSEDVSKL